MDYHLSVLQLFRVTKPIEPREVGDPTAATHQSDVAGSPWVRAQLAKTKAEDDAASSQASAQSDMKQEPTEC
jgi:hypothetical protein